MRAKIVVFFIVLSLVFVLPRVNAQPYFSVYPTEGNVNTDIFLQIRGLPGTGFYEYYYLYIFWDDILLGVFPDNSGTYEHFFDTHFSPPNSGNYSALGNHTVYFEVWNNGRTAMFINATFVFTITEYFPCDEWLALNATYTSLLASYSDILNDYNSLLADHNTLQANYNNLQNNYNSLLADYNNLLSSYNALASDYDSLSSNYYELESSYENLSSTYSDLLAVYSQLQSNYDGLQGSYDSLSADLNTLQALYSSLLTNYTNLQADYDSTCSNYYSLEVDYNSLESSYSNLETDYSSLNSNYNDLNSKHDTLASDLGLTKNLSYVFIVTTLVFIASTVYLAMRRPRAKPKAT